MEEHERRGGVEQEERTESEKGVRVRDQNNVQASLVSPVHARAKDPKRFEQHRHRPKSAILADCANRAFGYNDPHRFSRSEALREAHHHDEETADKSRFGVIS